MEKDKEMHGEGNSYTTEFRQYDPRLGRWLSLDPLMGMFPWMSPYVAFNDNPVLFIDPLGLEGDPQAREEPREKKYPTETSTGTGGGKGGRLSNFMQKIGSVLDPHFPSHPNLRKAPEIPASVVRDRVKSDQNNGYKDDNFKYKEHLWYKNEGNFREVRGNKYVFTLNANGQNRTYGLYFSPSESNSEAQNEILPMGSYVMQEMVSYNGSNRSQAIPTFERGTLLTVRAPVSTMQQNEFSVATAQAVVNGIVQKYNNDIAQFMANDPFATPNSNTIASITIEFNPNTPLAYRNLIQNALTNQFQNIPITFSVATSWADDAQLLKSTINYNFSGYRPIID